MSPEQLLDELIGLCCRLSAPGMLTGRRGDGLSDYRTALASLLLRASQSLKAVKILRRSGLIADARTIVRSLLEGAVIGRYLGTCPEELGTKFIIQFGLDQKKWFEGVKPHVDLSPFPPGEEAKIENAYKKAKEWYDSRGEPVPKKWVGVYKMAKKTGLDKEREYRVFYPRLSAVAHCSFFGMSELFEETQSPVIKPACHFARLLLTEVDQAFKLGIHDTLSSLGCAVVKIPPGV